jgi:hypothetical protein
MSRDALISVFEGLLAQPTGYEAQGNRASLDATFDEGADRIANAGIERMGTVNAIEQARVAAQPSTATKAKVGYNPTSKKFYAFEQELPEDFRTLSAIAAATPDEIPDSEMPAGYVPLTQEQLAKFLSDIDSEADFGAFGSSMAEGAGAAADAIGVAVGADESWNPWKGDSEEHRQGETLQQQKSHEEGGLGSLAGFGTAAAQGVGSAAPVIGAGVVGSLVGTPAVGLALATATGAAMGAGSQGDAARDRLWVELKGVGDAELQANSPYYAELRGDGISELEAKEALVRRGARAAAAVGGVLAVPETLIGGALLGNLARRVGLTALAGKGGRVAAAMGAPGKGALGSLAAFGARATGAGVAEGLQEVAETSFSQAAAGSATGVGPADVGSFASYDEFAAAAPVGFLFGALGGRGRTAAAGAADPLADLGQTDIGAAAAAAGGTTDGAATPLPDIRSLMPAPMVPTANPTTPLHRGLWAAGQAPLGQEKQQAILGLAQLVNAKSAEELEAALPQIEQLAGERPEIRAMLDASGLVAIPMGGPAPAAAPPAAEPAAPAQPNERETAVSALMQMTGATSPEQLASVLPQLEQEAQRQAEAGNPALQMLLNAASTSPIPMGGPVAAPQQGALPARTPPATAPVPQQRQQAVNALLQMTGAADPAQLESVLPQLQEAARQRADAGDPALQQLLEASGLVAIEVAPTDEQQQAAAAQAQQAFTTGPGPGPVTPQRSPGSGAGIGPRGREILSRVRGPQSAQAAAVTAPLPTPEPVAAASERTPDGRPVGVAPAPLPNPEPMSALEAEGRVQSQQELAERTGVSETTAEPEGDVAAQVAALVDPQNPKDAVFLAEGTKAPKKLPKNVQVVVRPGVGTLLTTSAGKAATFKTKAKLTDKDMARILGYPEDKASVQKSGAPAVAVEAKDPAGNVVASAVASPKGRAATEKAIGAQAPAGGRVEVSDPVTAQRGRKTRGEQLKARAKAAPKAAAPDPTPSPAKVSRGETIKAAARKRAAEAAPAKEAPKATARERGGGKKRRIKITPKDDKRRVEGIDLEVESVEDGARRDALAYRQEQNRLGGSALVDSISVTEIYAEALDQRQRALDIKVTQAEVDLRSKAERENPVALEGYVNESEKEAKEGAGRKPKSILDMPLLESEIVEVTKQLLEQLRLEARLITRGVWSPARSVMRRVLEAGIKPRGATSSDLDARVFRDAIRELAAAPLEQRLQAMEMLMPRLRESTLGKQLARGAEEVLAAQTTAEADVIFDALSPYAQTSMRAWEGLPDTVPVVSMLKQVTAWGDAPAGMARVLDGWMKLMGINTRVQLLDMKAAVAMYGEGIDFGKPGDTVGRFIVQDGKPIIVVDFASPKYNEAAILEVMAHEFGHLIQHYVFDQLSVSEKLPVLEAFDRWLAANGKKTPRQAMLARHPAAFADLVSQLDPNLSRASPEYALSFDEWFADQTARWATTSDKPQSVVDKVFHKIAQLLRDFHALLTREEAFADVAFEDWINGWVDQARVKAANAALEAADTVRDSYLDGREETGVAPEATPGVLLRTKRAAERFTGADRTAALQEAMGGIADVVSGRAPATAKTRETLGKGLLSVSTLRDIERRFRDRPGWGKHVSKWIDLQFRKSQVALKALEKFSAAMESAERLSAEGRDLLQRVMLDATTGNYHPDVSFEDKKNQHLRGGDPKVVAANRARWARGAAMYAQLKAQKGDKAYAQLRDTYAELHEDMRQRQRDNIANSGLSAEAKKEALAMFDRADKRKVQGPYFPLMRFGDWIVRAALPPRGVMDEDGEPFKTRAAADAEAAIQKSQNPHVQVKVEANDDGYVVRVYDRAVYFFETQAEARAATAEIEAELRQAWTEQGLDFDEARDAMGDKDPIVSNPMGKVAHYEQMRAPPQGFLAEVRQLAAAGKIDAQVAADFEQMAIEALPEFSFRKSTLPRQNIRGASKNMLAAYAMRASGAAHSYALAVHGRELSTAWDALEQARKDKSAGADADIASVMNALTTAQKMVVKRTEPSTFNAVTNVISDITSMFSLAFSPAYAATNAMQPAIVTTPVLAALNGKDGKAIGWTKAAKYMGDAYGGTPGFFIGGRAPKDFAAEFKRFFGAASTPEEISRDATQLIVDKFGKTPAEKAMLRSLLDRGTLDFSFLNSLHDAMRMGKWGQKWGALLRMGMAFPQQIEAMNRVVTALASYRIATKELGLEATEAVRFADDIVARTQLDYSRINRPAAFNMPMGFLLQFKLYMQGMYSLMITAGAKALNKDLSPAERKEAARTLGYFLLSHMAVGGMAGMGPVNGGAKMALGALAWAFGDDEDKWLTNEALLDRMARDLAGEILGEELGEKAATAALRGLPTLVGVDLADRIGLPNLVDSRYLDVREQDKPSNVLDKLLIYSLGAPYATGRRITDLVGYTAQGEFHEAAKKGTPSALRNFIRAGGWLADGVTDADGDVFIPRSELSPMELFATAMGFSSSDVNRRYAQRSAEYDTTAKIARARQRLVQKWRSADPDDREEASEAVTEFNSQVPKAFQIRPEQLQRSARDKQRRERGVLTREQKAARELVTGG